MYKNCLAFFQSQVATSKMAEEISPSQVSPVAAVFVYEEDEISINPDFIDYIDNVYMK